MRAASIGYVSRHLATDLTDADPHVQNVTAALQRVVTTDYIDDLLAKEKQSLHERYRDAARNEQSSAVTLLLFANWNDEIQKLDDRKKAAGAYASALDKIREGHHELASNPARLTAKNLASAIDPYTNYLESLIPTIQKGF